MTQREKHEKMQKNTRITINNTQFCSFSQNRKTRKMDIFAFCVITFEPNKI